MATVSETLEKFNNGEQRYEDDSNFKEAVLSISLGVGVYAVLDKTLNQLRVLREIHAKTIEQNKRLADGVDGLQDLKEYWKMKADKLTERLQQYESR